VAPPLERERDRVARDHGRSRELHQRAGGSLLAGVPMSFVAGVESALERHSVPSSVVSLGPRAEYRFAARPPRTGAESAAAADREVEEYLHLYLLNRGVRHTEAFTAALEELHP
jgi:glutamate-1-semialdehyde aminotransferase